MGVNGACLETSTHGGQLPRVGARRQRQLVGARAAAVHGGKRRRPLQQRAVGTAERRQGGRKSVGRNVVPWLAAQDVRAGTRNFVRVGFNPQFADDLVRLAGVVHKRRQLLARTAPEADDQHAFCLGIKRAAVANVNRLEHAATHVTHE